MRIDIVVVYVARYERGHELHFVPPITGIHLAAITPDTHAVRVTHQQTTAIDYETDADVVALSFFSGFAAEAYRIADRFRALGKTVVAGGPHATFWPDEALLHCDSVVIGEAESVWSQLLEDADAGRLKPVYRGQPTALTGLATPRYDLLPSRYVVRRVVQATRGCPFTCSFCSVPAVNPGFRMRPVEDVIADVAYDDFPFWWQRKVVWFWDDNLTAPRPYVKQLLEAMIPLNRWWLTQASIDIVRDEELLELLQASGCIGIFIGIESLNIDSLREAGKRQNRVREYGKAIEKLHARGICVMAGFIAGFDHDSAESIVAMADELAALGVDVPFLSVLTPFRGTPLWTGLESEGRLLDRGWEFFNGYNVAFEPKQMSPSRLLAAHRTLWRRAFSLSHVAGRMLRAALRLRAGAAMMATTMNAFYGLKGVTGNVPVDMSARASAADAHRVTFEGHGRISRPATEPLPPELGI